MTLNMNNRTLGIMDNLPFLPGQSHLNFRGQILLKIGVLTH